MMEFVSWDDDIPNIWTIKHVPNHQPDYHGEVIIVLYHYFSMSLSILFSMISDLKYDHYIFSLSSVTFKCLVK